MKQVYITKDDKDTKKVGEKMAEEILKNRAGKSAFVIGLVGDLGGGKTTFLQGFSKGLGIKENITSPTFVILKRFQLNNLTIKQFNNLFHIDCYRLKKAKEILDLSFKEIISEPKNIVVVEWADKIKKIMPKNTLWINFDFINERKREIKIF